VADRGDDTPTVLILAPRFHPDRHVSAIRVTEWARELGGFGWRGAVVARQGGGAAGTASVSLDGARTAVEVLTLEHQPLAGSPRRSLRSRAKDRAYRAARAVLVPDPTIRAWTRSAASIKAFASAVRPHVVLSSGPPHAVHAAGRAVATATGLPWVADFRDPFLVDPRFRPRGLARLRGSAFASFERSVYAGAAAVLHANAHHHRLMLETHRDAADRMHLVPNGYPAALLDEAERAVHTGDAIVTIGAAGGDELQALAAAVAGLRRGGRSITLHFAGWPSPAVDAAKAALGPAFVDHGRLPHDETLRLVASADVAVSCQSVDRSDYLGLSSKLYEFMAVGLPIVTINPTAPDTDLLREYGTGSVTLQRPSAAELEPALARCLDGAVDPGPDVVERIRGRYSRRAAAGALVEVLEAVRIR
jgi:hypothetical protein